MISHPDSQDILRMGPAMLAEPDWFLLGELWDPLGNFQWRSWDANRIRRVSDDASKQSKALQLHDSAPQRQPSLTGHPQERKTETRYSVHPPKQGSGSPSLRRNPDGPGYKFRESKAVPERHCRMESGKSMRPADSSSPRPHFANAPDRHSSHPTPQCSRPFRPTI